MLEPTLSLLEQTQLIRADQPLPELEYVFKHILVRDTTYETLLRQDRRRLNRLVAECLERAYAGRLDALATRLADHWQEAGEVLRAFEYAMQAGANAARVYANAEARMAYDHAVELSRELELNSAQLLDVYVRRGRVMELASDHDAAMANYEDLERLAKQRQDRTLELQALIRHATIHVTPTRRQDFKEGEELAQHALELARAVGDRPAEAQVLWTFSLLHQFDGHPEQAVADGELSLAIARELNLREQMAYTLNDLSRAYVFSNQFERGMEALKESEKLWREFGNLPMLTDTLNSMGMAALISARFAEGIASTLEGQRISDEIGNVWGQAYAAEVLGILHFELGDIAEAHASLKQACELGAQVGFLDALYSGSTFLGFLYGQMGAEERGVRFLEQMIGQYPQPGSWLMGPYIILGMLYAASGDLARAAPALEQGRSLDNGDQTSPFPILLGIADTLLAISTGQLEKARQVIDQLVSQSLQVSLNPFNDLVLFYTGRVKFLQGDLDDAHTTLSDARAIAESRQARPALWQILAELSKVEDALGNSTAASDLRQRACESVLYIADHAPADLRASFLARRDVQALNCI